MTETTRRGVLGSIGALTAAVGVTALAGCTGGDQPEASSDTVVKQSVTLETDAATAHVEHVGESDGVLRITEIRARVTDISADATNAVLTRHGDDATFLDNTQESSDTHTWDLSDGEATPRTLSANADGGDLFVFHVDDGSGEFKSATGRMFDIGSGGDGR